MLYYWPVNRKSCEYSSWHHFRVDQNDSVVEDEEEEEEEEETCPICLLEMVEGESITECVLGCKNKLHHHCIDVWFQECRQQHEPLTCPLCRHRWHSQDNTNKGNNGSGSAVQGSTTGSPQAAASNIPPNTPHVSSPQQNNQQCGSGVVAVVAAAALHEEPQVEVDVMLPHAEPIAAEYRDTAAQWIPVSCIWCQIKIWYQLTHIFLFFHPWLSLFPLFYISLALTFILFSVSLSL